MKPKTNNSDRLKQDVKPLLESGNLLELRSLLNSQLYVDVVELINDSNDEDQTTIFNLLKPKLALKTFKFLEPSGQKNLLQTLPHEKAAQILNDLSPDDRTALLEGLPGAAVKELLKLLSPEERKVTLSLLGYPEHSVGRLMIPDYVAVKSDWTAQQVLDYIKGRGADSETIHVIYVVDDMGFLVDDIKLTELLFISPDTRIGQIMNYKFVALSVTDDEESAISVFRKNYRVALPVVDAQGVLLGIVTIDDILRLAEEEDTQDIQKMGGTEAFEEPYLDLPFFKLIKKRAGWLIILFISELFTATAMGYFEHEIAKAVVLALFVPLIISSGGNSGSQASTLIIRAMALGEVTLRDWWRVMYREIFSGLILGFILGAIGFFRITVWSIVFPNVYGTHPEMIGLTVGLALTGVVLWGTLTGSMLPMFLKKLKFDPAVASAPFVATLVDVTGIVIYFSVAYYILKGILL